MQKRKICLLCLCFLALIVIGRMWARPDESISLNEPLEQVTAKSAHDDIFAPVRSKILESLKRKKIASISVAVARDGKIIWEEAFGWANREKQVKATPHTMYSLASISKPITATGLMVLVERGLVDLNQPANTYLGAGKLVAYEGKASDATVKRFLLHTAGLPMHWNFFYENEAYSRPSMDESIRRYGILVTAPGEVYNYSNFGYGIIDYIISRVSGKSYADFMKEKVFEPLGMTRTSVLIEPSLKEYVAQMYDERQKPIPFYDFDHRGASAVLSSAHDLVRFGMFHLKNHLQDQKQILTDEAIDALQHETDPQLPDTKDIIGFNNLLGSFGSVDYCGYQFLVATGMMPGAASRLDLIPSENIASVVLCNGDNIDLWEIEKEIFAALLPEYAKKLKAEEKKPEEKKSEKFSPPESLLGEWKGEIKTYKEVLPVIMAFKKNSKVSLKLKGKTFSPLNVKTPLGDMSFKDGVFRGPFFGNIKNEDTSRSPHILFLNMKLRGKRMSGFIAAVAFDKKFCLPSWIELKKLDNPFPSEDEMAEAKPGG